VTSRTPDEPPDAEAASGSEPGSGREPAPRPDPLASAGAASPDPEDWASTAGSGDDERYLRERPPHWE